MGLLRFPAPESCSSQGMHSHFLSLCCALLLCVLCCMRIILHSAESDRSQCDHLDDLTLFTLRNM